MSYCFSGHHLTVVQHKRKKKSLSSALVTEQSITQLDLLYEISDLAEDRGENRHQF